MKVIITSDTHKESEAISKVVEFAKVNGISTVLDCGDLHGSIDSFNGVKLHTIYWDKASQYEITAGQFYSAVERIGGEVHKNGTSAKLENILIFFQHDLAEYNQQIPQERLDKANSKLDELSKVLAAQDLRRFLLFGHTHAAHFNNDGRSIAINPGATGLSQGNFAVLDLDNNTIEYRREDKSIVTIPLFGDIKQMRDIRPESRIERLSNGNEVFVYKTKEGEQRTEEFFGIISAYNAHNDGLTMTVLDKAGMQQLIRGSFRSRFYNKVGSTFEEYENSKATGRYSAYIGEKRQGDTTKEVLVIGSEERESIEFDKVKSITPVIKKGVTIFIGQTKTPDFKADRGSYEQERNYTDSLVFNDQVIANYACIEKLEFNGKRAVLKVKEGKTQRAVTVDLQGKISEEKSYESVDDISDTESGLVYVAKENGKMFVVVNGQEQLKHEYDPKSWSERIREARIIDGKLAYVVDKEKSAALFIDGKEAGNVSKRDAYSGGIKYLTAAGNEIAYLSEDASGSKKVMVGDKVIIEDKNLEFLCTRNGKTSYKKAGKWYSLDGNEIVEKDDYF